jgi:hypothetical protein
VSWSVYQIINQVGGNAVALAVAWALTGALASMVERLILRHRARYAGTRILSTIVGLTLSWAICWFSGRFHLPGCSNRLAHWLVRPQEGWAVGYNNVALHYASHPGQGEPSWQQAYPSILCPFGRRPLLSSSDMRLALPGLNLYAILLKQSRK